jgi:hypothetical protein
MCWQMGGSEVANLNTLRYVNSLLLLNLFQNKPRQS